MAIESYDVSLSPDVWKLLNGLSSNMGKPPAEVVADALRQYESGEQKHECGNGHPNSVYESLQEGGFLGCIEGGPADLSTNPRYMQGFAE
jgi:hypothetical protein